MLNLAATFSGTPTAGCFASPITADLIRRECPKTIITQTITLSRYNSEIDDYENYDVEIDVLAEYVSSAVNVGACGNAVFAIAPFYFPDWTGEAETHVAALWIIHEGGGVAFDLIEGTPLLKKTNTFAPCAAEVVIAFTDAGGSPIGTLESPITDSWATIAADIVAGGWATDAERFFPESFANGWDIATLALVPGTAMEFVFSSQRGACDPSESNTVHTLPFNNRFHGGQAKWVPTDDDFTPTQTASYSSAYGFCMRYAEDDGVCGDDSLTAGSLLYFAPTSPSFYHGSAPFAALAKTRLGTHGPAWLVGLTCRATIVTPADAAQHPKGFPEAIGETPCSDCGAAGATMIVTTMAKRYWRLTTPSIPFRLTVNGQQTATISTTASAATVQTAIEALSNVAPGDVICTGGPLPTAVLLEWTGNYDPPTDITLTASGIVLTGLTIPTKSGTSLLDYTTRTVTAVDCIPCGTPMSTPAERNASGAHYDKRQSVHAAIASMTVNQNWRLTTPDTPPATFRLTVNGQQTATISTTASAATVQTAIEALSNVAPGDVICTGGPLPTAVLLEWTGNYDPPTDITLTASGIVLTLLLRRDDVGRFKSDAPVDTNYAGTDHLSYQKTTAVVTTEDTTTFVTVASDDDEPPLLFPDGANLVKTNCLKQYRNTPYESIVATVKDVAYDAGVVNDLFWPNDLINGATAPIETTGTVVPSSSLEVGPKSLSNQTYSLQRGGKDGLVYRGYGCDPLYGGRYLSASGAAFSQSSNRDNVRAYNWPDQGVSTSTEFDALSDAIKNCAAYAAPATAYGVHQEGPLFFAGVGPLTYSILEFHPDHPLGYHLPGTVGGVLGTDTTPRLYRQFGNTAGPSEVVIEFDTRDFGSATFDVTYNGSTVTISSSATAGQVATALQTIFPSVAAITYSGGPLNQVYGVGAPVYIYIAFDHHLAGALTITSTLPPNTNGLPPRYVFAIVFNSRSNCATELRPNLANVQDGPYTDLEFNGYQIQSSETKIDPCNARVTTVITYRVFWFIRVPVDSSGTMAGASLRLNYTRNAFIQYGFADNHVATFGADVATDLALRPNLEKDRVINLAFESDVITGRGYITPDLTGSASRTFADMPTALQWATFVTYMTSAPYASGDVTNLVTTTGAMPWPGGVVAPLVIDFSGASVDVTLTPGLGAYDIVNAADTFRYTLPASLPVDWAGEHELLADTNEPQWVEEADDAPFVKAMLSPYDWTLTLFEADCSEEIVTQVVPFLSVANVRREPRRVVARYRLPCNQRERFDVNGSNTLELISCDRSVANWPATLKVMP